MLIVKCISEEWNWTTNPERAKQAIADGAPTPKIGEEYIVAGDYRRDKDGYIGYQFEEFDWEEYGINVFWNSKNFEKVSEEFSPNHYDDIHHLGFCETFKMTVDFEFEDSENEEDGTVKTYTYTKE